MVDERLEALRLRDQAIGEAAERRTRSSGASRGIEARRRLSGLRRRIRLLRAGRGGLRARARGR